MSVHPKSSLRYTISAFAGKSLIRFLEVFVWLFSDKKAVFDSREFEWVEIIEAGWPDIKNEYLELTRSDKKIPDICDISEEQYNVIDRDKWTFFPLYIYGVPVQNNLAQCPSTTRLIEHIPNKTTVFFSILRPDTYIKPHRGAYKGYLRYHLGVVIPEPADQCGIRIKGKTYHWQNGKSLIFDDTYHHDAWNKTTSTRVVLYVDFIRPMPAILIGISKKLTGLISQSPFVQNALTKLSRQENDNSISRVLG